MNNIQYSTKFEAYLLTEKCVSKNTFHAYKRDIDQFISFLGRHQITLEAIALKDMKEFLRYLHDLKLAASSVVRKISSLKIFFAYLADRYDITDIAKKLHFPKVEKKLPHYLTEQEMKQLFQVVDLDTSYAGKRNRAMLYVLYATGMRISELISLRVSDIQLDTQTVAVTGKGGKQRLIPLAQPVLVIVQEYLDDEYRASVANKKLDNNNDYLFLVQYGGVSRPITRQAFWVLLNELWKKTGNKTSISPHKLRHSFATHMLKNGADLRSLQLLLGHENLSTVQVYTHVETSYLKKVYDKKHPRS